MDKNTMFHLGAAFFSSSARTNEQEKKNCYVTPNIKPNTEKPTRYTQSACCGGFIRSFAFSYTRLLSRNISEGKTRLARIRMTPSKLPFSQCCRCSVFVMSLTQSIQSIALARALAFSTFQQWRNSIRIEVKSNASEKGIYIKNKYAFFELFIFMCMNLDCVRRSLANIWLSLSFSYKLSLPLPFLLQH